MDREKVIKGIQECDLNGGLIGNCPYKDILAMLKEQDAELSYRKAKAITHTATKLDDATCPSCGNVVGEKIRTGAIGQSVVQVRWDYCRFCGQKLDWEGR